MLRLRQRDTSDLLISRLYDQNTFYKAFLSDIASCHQELIIESPFITRSRMNALLPVFAKLKKRGIHIIVNTRPPQEHNDTYYIQAVEAITAMQELGIKVLYTGGHHRKLAIIDQQIVWEGSLNILSYTNTCEIMRKMTSPVLAQQLLKFINIDKYLKIGA